VIWGGHRSITAEPEALKETGRYEGI
jgi:hypothetical protein